MVDNIHISLRLQQELSKSHIALRHRSEEVFIADREGTTLVIVMELEGQ